MKYCPLEYELIKEGKVRVTADLVESIAYHSDNPAFQTTEFRLALADYRKYKLRTPNKVKFDLEEEIKAIKHKLALG